MTEMEKLIAACDALGLHYALQNHNATNTVVVQLLDNNNEYLGDAICHKYSYGGPEGLLEIMGKGCDGDVRGWLTAKDVIDIWTAEDKEKEVPIMRDINRIPKIMSKLTAVWYKHPDMRLTQLISNLGIMEGYNDSTLFFMEDDQLLAALDEKLENF